MTQASVRERRVVAVRGIVQGVGFRPFIYTLARRHGLGGWVRNDAEGVHIEVEGDHVALDRFLLAISTEAPPLAVVEAVTWQPRAVQDEREFHIALSKDGERHNTLIAPDVAVCADCLREMFSPADRRYRYPFINCTRCGPRFTIIRAVPYDRALTTMADFVMCPACRQEYEDPADRRFHAQPNACPVCGPRVRLLDREQRPVSVETAPGEPEAGAPIERDAIRQAARLLRQGASVAVKGLGGYHLACNPFDAQAVATLRARKARQEKPFALMARDIAQANALCHIDAAEEALLTSPARPIVLLECRADAGVAADVAPRQTTLGIMLAYAPLHHLLLHDADIPLVMTSGNRSDEPIAYRDEDAFAQLADIADYFLTHDRAIHIRCDDSVARVAEHRDRSAASGRPEVHRPSVALLRRSRGYAPTPLRTGTRYPRHLLACGGELKNTFCVARDEHVFLSHHIGDLENYETLRSFREGIDHFCRLFDVQPELVAYDLHPDYLATRYAQELEEGGLPGMGVQHHHAHIAACLADNERPAEERVIGVALDGTGYGTDGAIWGGEFLVGSVAGGFTRAAHLEYLPLPGGEAAIRQPWRMALAQLIRLYGEEEALRLHLPPVAWAGDRNARLIARLLEHGLHTPQTSSAGRLFDAVAALIGVPGSRQATYEGQAAIELELAACRAELPAQGYPFQLRPDGANWIIETSGILRGVAEDTLAGKRMEATAARFHRTIAEIVVTGCLRLHEAPEMGQARAVALSGGVFQNRLLLSLATELLTRHGFTVYQHHRVPTNDGGLCLGQAALANQHFRGGNGF